MLRNYFPKYLLIKIMYLLSELNGSYFSLKTIAVVHGIANLLSLRGE